MRMTFTESFNHISAGIRTSFSATGPTSEANSHQIWSGETSCLPACLPDITLTMMHNAAGCACNPFDISQQLCRPAIPTVPIC